MFCLLGFSVGALAQADLPDSLQLDISDLTEVDQINKLIDKSVEFMYANHEIAELYADEALKLADDHEKLLPRAYNQRGNIYWINANYPEAIASFEQAKAVGVALDDSLNMAKSNNNLGMVYQDVGDFEKALSYLLDALSYFENTDKKSATATVCMNLGNVYHQIDQDDEAEKYYLTSAEYFITTKDTNSMCMIYNNLGLMLRGQGDISRSTEYFLTALSGYEALGYLLGQSKVLTNLGGNYTRLENYAQAESLYVRSINVAIELGNPLELAISHFNRGEMFLHKREYGKALKSMRTAQEVGAESGNLSFNATNHLGLALAYEPLGQYKEALAEYKLYHALNDSIFNESKAKSLAEMQVKYEIALKNKEIENLEQQNKLDRQGKWGLIVLLVLLSVIGLLIVLRQRSMIRREKLLKEKDREVHLIQAALAESEIKSAEASKQLLQEELNYKTREITNLAMNIVRRNDLLEVMDRELKELRKGTDEKKLKDLSILVSQTLSVEKERQEFQIFIQETQQNFFMKLEGQFPNLSQKEKRLCAMVRLGLSSKEIAAVFNIETSSVEVSRYRLRKKMALTTNEGLKEFLANF